MPPFSAINVEAEENVDDEVDIDREIQIDEALKSFHTALKLHAQGPRRYEEASAAYDSLFRSDIFKYPESATDFERAERHSHSRRLSLDPSLAHALEISQEDVGGADSSLPQTLYLAYKNHGQFALDGIRHDVKSLASDARAILENKKFLALAKRALHDYSVALDHDPSDAELWRRAARVAAFLGTPRISRYCLEAAIELDDDPAIEEVEPPSLAEGFAGEQLRAHLEVLSDDMALSHPIMGPYLNKSIPVALQKYLDPLPYLPNPTSSLVQLRATSSDDREPRRLTIAVPRASWADVGMALVRVVVADGIGGQAVTLKIPEIPEILEDDVQMLVERPKPPDSQEYATVGTPVEIGPSAQLIKEAEAESAKEKSGDQGHASADDVPAELHTSTASRKRSQSAAGLPEGAEEEAIDQKRSKRTRRTTTGDTLDASTLLAAQLQPFQAADQNLFQMTRNIIEDLGVTDRHTIDLLHEVYDSCASDTRISRLVQQPMVDLRDSLVKFDDETTKAIITKKETSPVDFSSFLEHWKPGSQTSPETPDFLETRGLKSFAQRINDSWDGIQDVAFEWVKHITTTYLTSKWPDAMKIAVVQVISHFDEDILNRLRYELDNNDTSVDSHTTRQSIDRMIQLLFELHLDVYERITNPDSVVDEAIRTETKGRLGRWFSFASQMSLDRPKDSDNSLSMRFLWSAVFSVTLSKGVSRDHVLHCWKSLHDQLAEEDEAIEIKLPNNAVMPEVSISAADREISKLTTMDFFLGLSQNKGNPVYVIESLEPVLNPFSVYTPPSDSSSIDAMETEDIPPEAAPSDPPGAPIIEHATQGLIDLWGFLAGTSTELRVFLWKCLGEAYDKIDYETKNFSCVLKGIEMVIEDFETDWYLKVSDDVRRRLFLKMLKCLDELLVSALSQSLNNSRAFDIVDEQHLRSSLSAVIKLACLLHVACMYEDEVRVGMTQHCSNGAVFQSYLTKLREMQVRNWSLLYTLLRAGISEDRSTFTTPENDQADYLAAVHQVLGLRKICKASNKIFLHMMRVDLLKFKLVDNWEDYLGQVLYDLYGLKLGVGLSEVQDHGCPPEKLERRHTTGLVERVAMLANRIPIKDLLKSDLKNTIEHMQQAMGQTKSNQQLIQNLRVFNQRLNQSIDPRLLHGAFRGNVSVNAVNVYTPDSALARQRWYFLLGMIAFTKFKGVDLNRRQTPGATDDLRIGTTFLRQQLQFTPDQWDAWFRLGECFDYDLDEDVLWTADKMNKERSDLVKYQRNAIHCYTLALSHSRHVVPDAVGESTDAMHDLYHMFGVRMYASSREPFAMEPFHNIEQRYYIHETGADTKDAHSGMDEYQVWAYAARLFRKAMMLKPKNWKNPYMLAKCLWKMYQKPATISDGQRRLNQHPTMMDVIDTLEKAVKVVSALPKPRHGQDPILEPHYKIVSVVHKLVMLGDLEPEEATDILQRQPYAIGRGNYREITEPEDWEPYVIKTLTHLKEKDRSNWQHRIIMRHARILFDDTLEDPGYVQAMAAFAVLRESMLTKTMVMNVWKCDAERPGRHHVYTEQYVRFVVKLLTVLKDKINFEALLRRLRKKGADFYHFNDLWTTCCVAYLRLIRLTYQIPPIPEDDFKLTTSEEFEIITARISDWSSDPETSDPALSAMQEVIELKRLNAGLMKAGAIDDLIADCYTAIYFEIGKTLPGPDVFTLIVEQEQRKDQDRIRNDATARAQQAFEKPANPLSNILNPQSHEDSGAEGAGGAESNAPPSVDTAMQRPTRRTGVRRSDILKKAEQAFSRAQEGLKMSNNAKSRGSMSSGKTPAADVDGSNDFEAEGEGEGDDGEEEDAGSGNDSVGGSDNEEEDTDMQDAEAGAGAEDQAQRRELSSVPGSVHDSADDESDLSDLSDVPPEDLLDEEEAQHLLFPELTRGRSSSSSHDSGEEGEEEDEDEGDEDRPENSSGEMSRDGSPAEDGEEMEG